MRILILCTGNSCRSQMAHGFMQSFDDSLTVCSAGTKPAGRVHPLAIKVMKEAGVDISSHVPHDVEVYLHEPWDYVITVCGGANESCPALPARWDAGYTSALTTLQKARETRLSSCLSSEG